MHDDSYLHGAKRLYMTATPRIYDDSTKAKAGQANAILASMDDESVFGPEFHRLGFGEAVSRGLLTDYKVLVLAVDEEQVVADLPDAARRRQFRAAPRRRRQDRRLLERPGEAEALRAPTSAPTPAPMQRAVAFAGTIANSQKFARLFSAVVEGYIAAHDPSDDEEDDAPPLRCEVQHVDGTFNVLERNSKLDWLKAPAAPGNCRVLSNARCLSEGVDVPALDAVMFLNPRKIGRRRRPVRRPGHAQSAGQAVRLHHPAGRHPVRTHPRGSAQRQQEVPGRLGGPPGSARPRRPLQRDDQQDRPQPGPEIDRIQIIGVGGTRRRRPRTAAGRSRSQASPAAAVARRVAGRHLRQDRHKVGTRRYWEDWAKDIADIADAPHHPHHAPCSADPAWM